MSLRSRVALFTALTSTLVLIGIGVSVLSSFRSDQQTAMVGLLEQQFEVLAQPAARAARTNRPFLDDLLTERLLAPAIVRVWDDDDLLLAVGAEGVDLGPPAEDGADMERVDGYALLTREFEARLPVARPLVVQIAVSSRDMETTLHVLRSQLVRRGALGVLLLTLGGWLVATAALRPLSRLHHVTEEVAESSDLSRRVVPTTSDPTEVRELAESFDVMMSRLEETDHRRRQALDSARTFGAAAAHELRTPMTSMGTNLGILADHPDHPERDSIVDELRADHRRMRQMLEGLRQLARGDVVGPDIFTEVELTDLVAVAVAEALRRNPGADIELVCPDDDIRIRGWADGIRIMVDNLIGNALLHGRSTDGSTRLSVVLEATRTDVRLIFDDAGPGIPPEERDIVTRRFHRGQTADPGAGSGLGLALVAQQVEIHGGTLEIGTSPRGGARLTVELPSLS